jgi:hypothetical protein
MHKCLFARNTHLFQHYWRRPEGLRRPCGDFAATRSARAENAALVPLVAALACRSWGGSAD